MKTIRNKMLMIVMHMKNAACKNKICCIQLNNTYKQLSLEYSKVWAEESKQVVPGGTNLFAHAFPVGVIWFWQTKSKNKMRKSWV